MKYCHKLLENVAREIAGEFYNDAANDNQFYKTWPKESKFINKQWGTFVRPARQALATMLGMSKYSESIKDEIMEALLLDRALPPNGDTAKQVPLSSLSIH